MFLHGGGAFERTHIPSALHRPSTAKTRSPSPKTGRIKKRCLSLKGEGAS
jgi:hypothetical protein